MNQQQQDAIAPMSYGEMERFAQAIVKSGFFGFTKPEEVTSLAVIAQEEGRGIGSVARDYHVVHNRPSLKADAILARFQTAGGKVEWLEYTPERCKATFSHPQGGSVTVEWTRAMANAAGLRSDTWNKYPRAMLRARCISEGVRTVFPAVLTGFYTPEECEDMEAPRPRKAARTVPEAPAGTDAPEAAKAGAVRTEAPAAAVVDAEIVEAHAGNAKADFAETLKAYRSECPEAYARLCEDLKASGWPNSNAVPPERYEDVKCWYALHRKGVKEGKEADNG